MNDLKNYKKTGIITIILIVFWGGSFAITNSKIDSVLDIATYQYKKMIVQVGDTTKYPRSLERPSVGTDDWTSGFFPGSMWYLYELTDNDYWKNNAAKWTYAIKEQTEIDWTHDLGFMFYCSFGNGYRLTGDSSYVSIMVDAANTLADRYVPTVGITDSWDWGSWETKTEAIIDNMMNLELLYWASKATNDDDFSGKATMHATTTMANHFRSDYSSYHMVLYNSYTGAVAKKQTHQGYSDESAWARGQGWGLYGFVMSYRETGDESFLQQAEHIADYIIGKLPADLVPYWDFDDPAIPSAPRDASAAALYSSALFELSQYSDKGQTYYNKAVQILESLMSDSYLAGKDENGYFILEHSTGNKPSNSEIDEPLNYADYYFLEALIRYKRLNGWNNVKPKIQLISDTTISANKTCVIPVSIKDDFIDSVSISFGQNPGFASYVKTGVNQGTITLNPTNEDAEKEYEITLIATDKSGETDTVSFKAKVLFNYTGVEQNTLTNTQLLAYPNPCFEELSLKLSNVDGSMRYSIYNISGEMVQTEIINHIEGTYVVNVSNLESGVYMYKVINENKIYVGKFIKQ